MTADDACIECRNDLPAEGSHACLECLERLAREAAAAAAAATIARIKGDVARLIRAFDAVLADPTLTRGERAVWCERMEGLIVMSKAADQGYGYVVLEASGYTPNLDAKLDRWNDRRSL